MSERACPFCGAAVTSSEPVAELRLLSPLDRSRMVALGAALSAAGILLACREPVVAVAIYGAPAPPLGSNAPVPSAAPSTSAAPGVVDSNVSTPPATPSAGGSDAAAPSAAPSNSAAPPHRVVAVYGAPPPPLPAPSSSAAPPKKPK